MGQKVNPTSMRLQLNHDWSSKWFADKKDYSKFLEQDLIVRKIIDKKIGSRASINRVEINRTPNMVSVTISTAKAGIVIGKGGTGANELKAEIEKIYGIPTKINIEEIKKPDLFAKLLAQNIAYQLEKRVNFKRAIKSAAANAMKAGAKGVRVEVAGRLNGVEMSRREKEVSGSVPLHTLRANIDFAKVDAHTIAGIIGIKVWIYKGEVN
jgi:small subunit ribosomal protein S3